MDTSVRYPSSGRDDSQNIIINNQSTVTKNDSHSSAERWDISNQLAKTILTTNSDFSSEIKFKAFTADEIEKAVKERIINRYVKKTGFFSSKLESKKQNGVELNLSKHQLEKLISKAAKQLANQPLGTTVSVSFRDSWGRKKVFDATLVQNKHAQLSMKIQKLSHTQLEEGGQGSIQKSVAIHSGKESIFKKDKHVEKAVVHKESKIHENLYANVKALLNDEHYQQLLEQISPPGTTKMHIPILKAPTVAREMKIKGRTIKSGIYLEKGMEGDLFNALATKGKLTFQDRIQIAKDLTVALILLENAGYSHLDLKPENVALFVKDGRIRAKLIDMGFAENHLQVLSTIFLDKASANYIDSRGIRDSLDTVRRPYMFSSASEINHVMIRRDRVAFARLLIHLLYPTAKITQNTLTAHSVDWTVHFDAEHAEIEKLYNALHSDKNFFDLSTILPLLESFEANRHVY